MNQRNAVLGVVLAFVAGFAFLTFLDVWRNGVTPMAVVAIVVLVLLGIGLFGAFGSPPRRR